MPLRETGSIVVPAPRDRVYAIIAERMASEPGLRTVFDERIESRRKTFVLSDDVGGTRVVMARTEEKPVLAAARDDLRLAVSEELLSLQKLAR
jgi:hypothetical protein